MRKPSFKQAEWIYSQLADSFAETADDVYDVLLGNITSPRDFCDEVKALALDYEDDLRRHNVG
jgi:hypothetical protein